MKEKLDRRLTVATAERLIAKFAAEQPAQLELDVDQLERFELLAESRVLLLLAMARRAGVSVRVMTTQSIDLEAKTPKRLSDLFSETLGGVILAQMANEVIDGSGKDKRPQLVRSQAEHAVSTDGFFGFGREQAAPIVDLFGGPPPALMVDDQVGTDFDPLFRTWVTSKMNLPVLTEALLQSLIKFAFETFDNSHRHGSRDLNRRALEGVRFVLLRRINLAGNEIGFAADRVNSGPVADYLKGLSSRSFGPREFLVELTIADCGVGIPATLAKTDSIYEGRWSQERDEVLGAFEGGKTSRRISGVGRGLLKALAATEALRGMIALRTGRTQLHRSFLPPRVDSWQAEEMPRAPGTTVSLLFIWRDPTPPTLFEP